MLKLSDKRRKWLRKFYQFFGVAAVSLIFQACYGMPMDYCCPYCWDNCECEAEDEDGNRISCWENDNECCKVDDDDSDELESDAE